MSATRPPRGERAPARRRVVAAYALLAILAVAGLVGVAEALRLDHPVAGPVTPELDEAVDTLREDIDCPVPAGREGRDRPVVTAQPALPQPVTSNALYDCPDTYDGGRVHYTGEVVGAVLDRGDLTWVQLNDDVYADGVGPLPTHRDFRGGNAGVGARMSAADAAMIGEVGGPGRRGDLVEVVATFHRVDRTTTEVAVLEVHSMRILRPGAALPAGDAPARPYVAGLAAVAALVVVVIDRRRRDP